MPADSVNRLQDKKVNNVIGTLKESIIIIISKMMIIVMWILWSGRDDAGRSGQLCSGGWPGGSFELSIGHEQTN